VNRIFGLVLFLVPTLASANDTAWGGTPGNLFPIQTTEVEMVEEHVILQQNSKQNSWDISVEFSFKNTSDKPVELTMGFPFFVVDEDNEGGDFNQPKGSKPLKQNDPVVWDFSNTIDGVSTKFKKQEVKLNEKHPDLYYKWAYVWPMKFKAGQTIKVVNKYRQGITADSSGHILPNYILMTGGMWKGGKIGRSRIDILGDDDAIPCGPNDGQITPPGSRLDKTDAGPALRWDLEDFAPKTDVEGCFLSRSQSRMMEFSGLQGTDLKGLTAAELRVLRNTVFALHGYTFKDADLQKHFEKQRYYYPRKSFKQSDLSKEEREFVNLVLAQEKALKKK